MSPPNTPSLQLLSLNVNGLRGKQKRAALFATLQSGPWQVIALQETHHANQTEAAQWCREGAGPTAPWDGPSFWATGTSASRGVALLFKPSPLLSRATSAAVDPNGRFVAVKCDLSGSQITIASVYAPVERQERTPFFHSSLLFFFFLGGKDIHYTSAMIATSRVCDVHHKPKRPKLTTHLEWFRHES